MKASYKVNIFEPDDMHISLAWLEATFPPSWQVGHIINLSEWDSEDFGDRGPHYRIRALEHKIQRNLDDPCKVDAFLIGVHLEALSKKRYFQAAVGREPMGAE